MKGLKLLIMSLFAVLFLAGCEVSVAGDECESNADCDTNHACYAGYCSSIETPPTGGMFIKLDFADKVTNDLLECKFTGVTTVELTFKRGTFLLPAVDSENGYEDELGNKTSFEYKYVIPCEKLSREDLDQNRGFYIGEKDSLYNEAGEGKGPFQQGKGYIMIANFKKASGELVANQEFDVTATSVLLSGESQPVKNTTVKVEKVVTAVLTIAWEINQGGDIFKDSSACIDLGIKEFKVLKGGFADTDNTYVDYTTIPCGGNWNYVETIFGTEANTALYVYAVNTASEKLYKYESTLNVTQAQFETGTVNKTVPLIQVSNKK